jgi:hypothetical protein
LGNWNSTRPPPAPSPSASRGNDYANQVPYNTLDLDGKAPSAAHLSEDEQRAVDNKNAGRKYDLQAYNRAMKKIRQAEKYAGSRNQSKRRKGSGNYFSRIVHHHINITVTKSRSRTASSAAAVVAAVGVYALSFAF